MPDFRQAKAVKLFIPKAPLYEKAMAGLLTHASGSVPSRPFLNAQWLKKRSLLPEGISLTATGIVPDFHRIPYYFHLLEQDLKTISLATKVKIIPLRPDAPNVF